MHINWNLFLHCFYTQNNLRSLVQICFSRLKRCEKLEEREATFTQEQSLSSLNNMTLLRVGNQTNNKVKTPDEDYVWTNDDLLVGCKCILYVFQWFKCINGFFSVGVKVWKLIPTPIYLFIMKPNKKIFAKQHILLLWTFRNRKYFSTFYSIQYDEISILKLILLMKITWCYENMSYDNNVLNILLVNFIFCH